MLAELSVEVIDIEQVLTLPLCSKFPLHIDLHEKNLRDFIKGCSGIELLAIANDVVTLMEKIGELVFLERFEFWDELFDFLITNEAPPQTDEMYFGGG